VSTKTGPPQSTDRFTKAIAQLGDDKLEIKLGGIYALERIAKDSERDYSTIIEVLTTYMRENSSILNYNQAKQPSLTKSSQKNQSAKKDGEIRLPADIQAILTVIGRRVERGYSDRIDLSKTFLSRANLANANLNFADLREANFREADLSGADLFWANLRGVDLSKADLNTADLRGVDLSEIKNLTWEQISVTIIDRSTKLSVDIEEKFKNELKAMRERGKEGRRFP
jgi:Pentapeptide repeats (8 copies)